jgi:hypothetical protein
MRMHRLERDDPPAHPLGTPTAGTSPHCGPLASGQWLRALGIEPTTATWFARIAFDADPQALFDVDERTATRFELEIFDNEWGFKFCHVGKLSWIRVTDEPFAQGGRDEHALLPLVPPLREIGALLRAIERMYAIQLRRNGPLVRTDLPNKSAIREWAFAI